MFCVLPDTFQAKERLLAGWSRLAQQSFPFPLSGRKRQPMQSRVHAWGESKKLKLFCSPCSRVLCPFALTRVPLDWKETRENAATQAILEILNKLGGIWVILAGFDHSNESFSEVLSCGTVYYVVQGCVNLRSVNETLACEHSPES